MIARHTFKLSALCPVNDGVDLYEVTVEANRLVTVESIGDVAASFAARRIYQEDLTVELALRLCCRVTTVGFHSGIRTEVVA